MEKKIEKLENNIVNALIEWNVYEGADETMSQALGGVELTNEALSIMVCFNEAWERADSEDDRELDRILDHYTGEIIKWLKANGLYEHALNNTTFSPC